MAIQMTAAGWVKWQGAAKGETIVPRDRAGQARAALECTVITALSSVIGPAGELAKRMHCEIRAR